MLPAKIAFWIYIPSRDVPVPGFWPVPVPAPVPTEIQKWQSFVPQIWFFFNFSCAKVLFFQGASIFHAHWTFLIRNWLKKTMVFFDEWRIFSLPKRKFKRNYCSFKEKLDWTPVPVPAPSRYRYRCRYRYRGTGAGTGTGTRYRHIPNENHH